MSAEEEDELRAVTQREDPEGGGAEVADGDSGDLKFTSRLPTFDVFSAPAIYDNLENIYHFDLKVEVPKMYQLVNNAWSHLITGRMYEAVLSTLDSSGFYKTDSLTTVQSDTEAGVRFLDDEYQFDVIFDRYGDLHIRRGGSTLKRFYEWYGRFMPSVMSLVDVILNAVAEVVTLTLYGRDPNVARRRNFKLTPVAVSYGFSFIAYDFIRPQSHEIEKNVSVLRNLLRVVPGIDGDLQDPAQLSELGHLGAIDVNLCRFVEDVPDLWTQEFYKVTGPSDRRYTMLYINFVYRGESFDTPTGARQKFRPDLLLNNYEVPMLTFLKGRAIEKYLSQLTSNLSKFQTSTGSLP